MSIIAREQPLGLAIQRHPEMHEAIAKHIPENASLVRVSETQHRPDLGLHVHILFAALLTSKLDAPDGCSLNER